MYRAGTPYTTGRAESPGLIGLGEGLLSLDNTIQSNVRRQAEENRQKVLANLSQQYKAEERQYRETQDANNFARDQEEFNRRQDISSTNRINEINARKPDPEFEQQIFERDNMEFDRRQGLLNTNRLSEIEARKPSESAPAPQKLPINNIDPESYTPSSVADFHRSFQENGKPDYSLLQANKKDDGEAKALNRMYDEAYKEAGVIIEDYDSDAYLSSTNIPENASILEKRKAIANLIVENRIRGRESLTDELEKNDAYGMTQEEKQILRAKNPNGRPVLIQNSDGEMMELLDSKWYPYSE